MGRGDLESLGFELLDRSAGRSCWRRKGRGISAVAIFLLGRDLEKRKDRPMKPTALVLRRLSSILAVCLVTGSLSAEVTRVYFGTYTREGGSKGIYTSEFDDDSGELGDPVLAAEMNQPSFLALTASGETLYAVSEVPEGRVQAFKVLDSGLLEPINSQSSGGADPCHVSLSPNGKFLAAANYSGGSVASYTLAGDGALSEPVSVIQHVGGSVNPERQARPHAHSINFSPDSRFAYAADLGTDHIEIYAVNGATGALDKTGRTGIAPGSGPRHFTLRADGRYAYVINELSLTITAFKVDEGSGALTRIQTISTLPDGTPRTGSTAEIVAHPSGKFLYGSNRGHDSISIHAIDAESGELASVGNEPARVKTPRNFVISPNGKWLLAAGQDSGNVTVFAIDQKTGALTFSGKEIKIDRPVCIRFLPRP
jgi:6-phosphogluconolactonase